MSNKINWTEAQASAINAGNCDLLVSASAGSGKTAVLVQRILDHVTEEKYNGNILEMLVVTFTIAAAGQLKDKLKKAIKKAIAQDPHNKRLRRQLRDLPRASISTINSFCLDVVKTHYAKLGLSANLRIADQSENDLLMAEIMEQTIELFYDKGEELGISNFSEFCNNFARLSDSGLGSIFMGLYSTLYSQLEGFELLRDRGGLSTDEPFDNIWGAEIRKKTLSNIIAVKRGYQNTVKLLEVSEKLEKAYGPAFYSDMEFMDGIIEACDKGYNAVRNYINSIKFTSLGSTKGVECKETIEKAKRIRNFFKNVVIPKHIAPLYINDVETAQYLGERTAKMNRELYCFLKYFHKVFMAEKNRRGIVSFGDCEVLTLELLCDNGKPTETALEYRRRFKEIYIDEYQDVNSVQDTIFRMIAGPDTRFMVGDIKQSIYAFRGGEPRLFEEYRTSFIDYIDDPNARKRGCRLFLSNNFRSSENIIKFANKVSADCFNRGESSVEYMAGDDLVFSKTNVENDDREPVTVALIAQNDEKNSEASYVCDRIEELLAKGIKPSDITLLFRSMKAKTLSFISELEKRGIPYYCDVKKEFFDNPEIMLTLCWLNTIDNPRRDVFVCGIAKSPVYNFTLDELIRIKRCCNCDTLYNSIKEYTMNHDFEKGRRFISDIEELRSFARGNSAHSVVWKLMYEKGLMSIVTKDKSSAESQIAHNNLLLFYDYARNFENGEFKGVYNFLLYIEKVIDAKQALPSAVALAASGNTVKIMTIHNSKGLEFPYCFLCDCDKPTSTKDITKELLFHRDFGIAAKIADETGLVMYNSYIMSALKSRIFDENIDEEYRVLYVALTRAVNRLWITATAKDPIKTYDKMTDADELMSKLYTSVNHNYIAWILGSLSGMEKSIYRLELVDSVTTELEEVKIETEGTVKVDLDLERLRDNISFVYGYKDSGSIPAKMSVSGLYPDILDDIGGSELRTVITAKRPYFASGSTTNRGVEIGNMTHAFMQFCDFDAVERNGVAAELERLCDRKYLPDDARELVNIRAVESFFSSELYSSIRASGDVYREKRFNVNLPASNFTNAMKDEFKDETVLVQGVIDCFYYDTDGNIVLVDYKTDFVKTPNVLVERYSEQLNYYKKALEIITGDNVIRTVIYSFSLDCCIDL